MATLKGRATKADTIPQALLIYERDLGPGAGQIVFRATRLKGDYDGKDS